MSWWYVYFLKSLIKDDVHFGSTDNLYSGTNQHNNGYVQLTKAYRLMELAVYVAVRTAKKARKLGKCLKKDSGKTILDMGD